MKVYPLRLHPDQDLKRELLRLAAAPGFQAGFILTCVGSLKSARLRLAGATQESDFSGPFEILALSGTLSPDGVHLHVALADKEGKTIGGHLLEGCPVYTTAELVIGLAEDWHFRRALDPATGYKELLIGKA